MLSLCEGGAMQMQKTGNGINGRTRIDDILRHVHGVYMARIKHFPSGGINDETKQIRDELFCFFDFAELAIKIEQVTVAPGVFDVMFPAVAIALQIPRAVAYHCFEFGHDSAETMRLIRRTSECFSRITRALSNGSCSVCRAPAIASGVAGTLRTGNSLKTSPAVVITATSVASASSTTLSKLPVSEACTKKSDCRYKSRTCSCVRAPKNFTFCSICKSCASFSSDSRSCPGPTMERVNGCFRREHALMMRP